MQSFSIDLVNKKIFDLFGVPAGFELNSFTDNFLNKSLSLLVFVS